MKQQRCAIAQHVLDEYGKTSHIEFCMDVLGVKTVTREIGSLIGSEEKNITTILRLCSTPDWVPAYKKKLDEMFSAARAKNPQEYHDRFEIKKYYTWRD